MKGYAFRADCSRKVPTRLDWDEVIRVKPLTRAQTLKLFKSGSMNDAKTIAALAFAGVL